MILKGRSNEKMHTKAITRTYYFHDIDYDNDLRRQITMITMITVILIMTINANALTTMNTKAMIMIISLIMKKVMG